MNWFSVPRMPMRAALDLPSGAWVRSLHMAK
jgi:hypothetical protein